MSRCQYIFTHGSLEGSQCTQPAGENGFCLICNKTPNRDTSNINTKTPYHDIYVADTSTMIEVGTLQQLAQRVDLKDFLQAAFNFCELIHNNDISLDITATAKYLSQIPLQKSKYDAVICVVSNKTAVAQCRLLSASLHETGPWAEVASFKIKKNPLVSDIDALLLIIWLMTKQGWRQDFFEWAGIDQSTPITEYPEIFRNKIN